jgi:cytochrome d ubiquinol oxidase subunit II
MHGALYLSMKTEGDLRARVAAWVPVSWMVTMALYVVATIATIFVSPFLFEGVLKNPFFWVLIVILLAAAMYIPVAAKGERYGRALIASSLTIACMIGLSALSLFPRLVPSITDLRNSLTVECIFQPDDSFHVLVIAKSACRW